MDSLSNGKARSNHGLLTPKTISVEIFGLFYMILVSVVARFNVTACDILRFSTKDLVLPTLATVENAHACSPILGTNNSCRWFTTSIACADNERILIRDAVFGFKNRYISKCAISKAGCYEETDCCPMTDGDESKEYTVEQKYEVYKSCSWKTKCSQRSQVGYSGKTRSVYSVLKYECMKEKETIHFCQEALVTGKSINIILDGVNSRRSGPSECICDLMPRTLKVTYTVNAPDLRLMPESQNCSTGAVISGLENRNISCSSKFTNMTFSRILLGERRFRLSFKEKPEFVWIKADVYGSRSSSVAQVADPNMISVQCYKAAEREEKISGNVVTESCHLKRSFGTSLGISRRNNLGRSCIDTGKNEGFLVICPGEEHARNKEIDLVTKKDSMESIAAKEFPIYAIVIPAVLVVSGLAVLMIFIIRYRCKKDQESLKEDNEVVHRLDRESSTEKMKYDRLFSPESVVRTDDNYIELDPVNAYSSINAEAISTPVQHAYVNEAATIDDMTLSDEHIAYSAESQQVAGYANATAEPVLRNEELYNNSRVENDMNSVIKDLDPETHTYSVLDPQSLYQYSDMAGLSHNHKPKDRVDDPL